MNPFSSSDLERMRSTQSGAMMDLCTVRSWSPTIDSLGSEIEGWTVREGVPCGLDVSPNAQAEQRREVGTAVTISATLRLRLEDGEGLSAKDSVIVTHRNGEALSPQLSFGLDGPPKRGPTGVVLALVRVD